MGWRGTFYTLFLLVSFVESTSRSGKVWSLSLGNGPTFLHSWTITTAFIFVLVAVVLSTYLIFEHLAAYNQPEEQKFLIGLILMVPVYALESFLSLLDSKAAFNCEVIRDCYEAFALYCFERYLIACLASSLCPNAQLNPYLGWGHLHHQWSALFCIILSFLLCYMSLSFGGEDSTIEFMERQSAATSDTPLLEEAYSNGVVEHPFPLNCLLKGWYLGPDFYYSVKIGIVQYMIVKLICALLAMVLEVFGVYGEGKFQWNYGYPYLAVVLNFSQTWALYCLVQFYTVTKDKLQPIRPLAKFLTVKSIVFLTWWQGVAVAFLFSIGAFKGSLAQELKTRIQDYIICIEMGVAAVVHLHVFPAVSYKRGERCVRNVAVMDDYAALGTPPDPEEVQDCGRFTRMRVARHDDRKRLNFPQSVRDVVLGSGEIIVDDMKFTVSHVVEPVERGLARVNKTLHDISENVKRLELRKKSKDDSDVPLRSWTKEFSEVQDDVPEGSFSDSGLSRVARQYRSRSSASQFL